MSATTVEPTTPSPVPPAAPAAVKVTLPRVITSEWIKFRSIRSSVWTMLVAVTLLIGLGALISVASVSQWDDMDAAGRATFDPIGIGAIGTTFAQLATGVLAVLMISGEYATGTIRSSLTVVPRRLPVLWAKLIVFSGLTFVIMLAAAFVAFFVSQAILSGKDLGVSIADDHAVRAMFGVAGYLTLAGVIAMALGLLTRSTAAGLATLVGVFLVLPPVVSLLPDSLSDHISKYLPSAAGQSMYGTGEGSEWLSPGGGLLVFGAYALVLVAVSAWRLRTADV